MTRNGQVSRCVACRRSRGAFNAMMTPELKIPHKEAMKHGSLTSPPPFARALPNIGAFAVALLLASCVRADSAQGSSIVIDHEVLVPGLAGKPNAMARLSGGGFVIVGAWGTAWAAGTDASGKLLWKHEEPRDPLGQFQEQSEFHGVGSLANGGALLWGQTSNKDHEAGIGLIVIISASGHVVERRNVFPNDDQNTNSSAFRACFPWGAGFSLTGGGYDGQKGFVWLMQVDKNGAKELEKTSLELPGISGVATPNVDLVLMGSPTGVEGVTVVRFNQQGKLIASRKTNFLDARPVRFVDVPNEIKLIAVDNHNNKILLTFNKNL